MLTIEAQLLPEQRTCLSEFSADIHDAFADPTSAAAAIGALHTALCEGTPHAWARAVSAVAQLLSFPASDAPAGACRRLARFVAENADLLRSEQ